MPHCAFCGAYLVPGDRFCCECGTSQVSPGAFPANGTAPQRMEMYAQPPSDGSAEPQFYDLQAAVPAPGSQSAPPPAVPVVGLPTTGIVVPNGPSLSSGIQVHGHPLAKLFSAGNSAMRTSATFVETSEVNADGASTSEVCTGLCGWILSFIVWGLIGGLAYSSSTDRGFKFVFIGMLVIAYLLYLGSSLGDPVADYLRSANRTCPKGHIAKLLCNPPKMSMHIECYHEPSSRNSNGHSSTTTFVTHTAEEPVVFRCWDDVSQIVFPQMGPSLVRLELELLAEAADDATLSAIDAQYTAFVARNMSDEKQRHSVKVSVDDFSDRSRALLITDGATMGCFGYGLYVLFTLLTLSAPHRMIFKLSLEPLPTVCKLYRACPLSVCCPIIASASSVFQFCVPFCSRVHSTGTQPELPQGLVLIVMPCCTSCGSTISSVDRYCSVCGAATQQRDCSEPPKFLNTVPDRSAQESVSLRGGSTTCMVAPTPPQSAYRLRVHGQPLAKQFPCGNRAMEPSGSFVESADECVGGFDRFEKEGLLLGWVATIFLWVVVAGLVISFKTDQPFKYLLLPAAVVALVLYVGSAIVDPCATYLWYTARGSPEEYFQKLLCNPPKMSMQIECGHTTKSRQSNKHSNITEHVTHTAEEPVPFRFWDDVSRVVFPQVGPSLVRLELELVAEAADEATLSVIEAQHSEFVKRNTGDEYQKHSVKVSVDGYPSRNRTLLITDGATAGCFGLLTYVFFTLLTLSAPYRMVFYACTSRVKVQIKKVVLT